MERIEGGTILPISDFWLGSARSGHTSELDGRPVSQIDLDATNTLQATSWRINRRILEVAQTAWELGHASLGIDRDVPPPMPVRVPAEEFATFTTEQRQAVSRTRSEAREAVASWRSKVRLTSGLLAGAQADAEHDHLWIHWSHDARLRRYARVASGPGPQGSGLSKALLQFSVGKALGSRGLFWLAVRAGTAAGLDKLDHAARAAWADEHTGMIRACAREPFAYDWWFKDRDDPWALLATCFEINDALSSGDPAAFASHLPVQVDGTCNGLQHLSALGLDTVGAEATNLGDDAARHDIYAEVAVAVQASVDRDVAAGHEIAPQWVGLIDRNRVKRGVMTTNYGVTPRGMLEQLIEDDDGGLPGDDKQAKRAAAAYLRDIMWSAIGEVAHAAREIMDWLQKLAVALGEAGLPLRWETPTGSTIQQAYRPWSVTRPVTALGQVVVASSLDRTSVKPRKQALAAAPNFVHSFDAAHMALTVLECSQAGITHYSMIHDSYGTHAADMDTMNEVLRRTFVAIYRDDWLARTYEFVRAYAGPYVDLPAPPGRGTFDLNRVASSPWFFA